jgi:hypothetical protein
LRHVRAAVFAVVASVRLFFVLYRLTFGVPRVDFLFADLSGRDTSATPLRLVLRSVVDAAVLPSVIDLRSAIYTAFFVFVLAVSISAAIPVPTALINLLRSLLPDLALRLRLVLGLCLNLGRPAALMFPSAPISVSAARISTAISAVLVLASAVTIPPTVTSAVAATTTFTFALGKRAGAGTEHQNEAQ